MRDAHSDTAPRHGGASVATLLLVVRLHVSSMGDDDGDDGDEDDEDEQYFKYMNKSTNR